MDNAPLALASNPDLGAIAGWLQHVSRLQDHALVIGVEQEDGILRDGANDNLREVDPIQAFGGGKQGAISIGPAREVPEQLSGQRSREAVSPEMLQHRIGIEAAGIFDHVVEIGADPGFVSRQGSAVLAIIRTGFGAARQDRCGRDECESDGRPHQHIQFYHRGGG